MQRRQFLATLAVLALCQGVGWPRGGGGLRAHRYVFSGKLVDRNNTTLTVLGKDVDGQAITIPFAIDHNSQLPANVEIGDTVIVHYDYTLESNVYAADEVQMLPAGYRAPKSTFPDQRQPTDKTN